MPTPLQSATEHAFTKLPYGMQRIGMPSTLPANGRGSSEMRAGVEEGNPVSPLYVSDQKDYENPDYAPQLLRHEQTHRITANWPEKLQEQLPAINPKAPYNYGGAEGIEKIGSNPLKLSTEQMASVEQHLQAMEQNGELIPESMKKLDENFQAVPLSIMQPTDPHGKGINTMARVPGLPPGYNPNTGKLLEADDTIPVKPGSGQAPWEKYASSPASGPWEKYGATAKPMNSAPQATIGPTSEQPWLTQAEEDLREGGNQTLLGRTLGHLQGRGDKGYSGLESGVSPQTAEFMGSPELGTIHALQGEDETLHGHPLSGGWKTIKGIGEAATIPGLTMGGPEAEGAMNLIPSKSHAAGILNDIESAAENVPVYMENTKPALDDFSQYVNTGGKNARVMTKLGKRIEDIAPRPAPEPVPITQPGRLLGAGTEDIPLNEPTYQPGTPSKPITLLNPERMGPKGLPMPSHETPMSSYSDIFPDQLPSATSSLRGEATPFAESKGLGQGEYIGQIPGERGGMTEPAGVLRRLKTFDSAPPLLPEAPQYGAPVNFPEARDFYTNISRATAKPGFLRRKIESPLNPSFRMNAGNVREALNSDLTDAANRIGRGPDYAGAMNEYRNAARLIKGLKVGGSIAAAEALHKSGLLGKAAGGVMKVTQ